MQVKNFLFSKHFREKKKQQTVMDYLSHKLINHLQNKAILRFSTIFLVTAKYPTSMVYFYPTVMN